MRFSVHTMVDANHTMHPDAPMYTFWDYKRRSATRGLRIDHLLWFFSTQEGIFGVYTLDSSAEMMAEHPSTVEAAKRYLARGWSVLPLRPGDKRPLIRGEYLKQERPSEHDIAEWFRRWPDANIGIVTGETLI